MTGRKATLGLSLLCALAFCAFAAQSATAVPAKNTTAFTCVQNGGLKDFQDPHCDQKVVGGQGQFGHVPIPLNQTTEITVSNAKTQNATAEASPTVFKFKFEGKPVEVTCKTVHGVGTLHNVEPILGEHKVTGTLTITVTECKVKPMKCTVKEPIEFKTEFEGVEGLGPEENTHGIEYRPHVEGGGALMTIAFEGGAECFLNEKTVAIKGTMIATGGPAPNEKHSGATQIFTNEMTKETLKVGMNPAEHSGALTMRMAPIGGQEQSPIAFTTFT